MSTKRESGFTLFELMVVVAIILVVASIATPAMSGFFKTSKVRQAAETLRGAMMTAQLNSVRTRQAVGLYFDYPIDGLMEAWTVSAGYGGGSLTPYPDPELGTVDPHTTFAGIGYWRFWRCVPRPFRLPEGIRIIACNYSTSSGEISWPHMGDSALGRIKAHWTAFSPTGAKLHWSSLGYCYCYYLVVEEGSGEYLFVHLAQGQAARPRIRESWVIEQIEGVPVTDPTDIWPAIRDRVYPFGQPAFCSSTSGD